jgi:hypothetical protein
MDGPKWPLLGHKFPFTGRPLTAELSQLVDASSYLESAQAKQEPTKSVLGVAKPLRMRREPVPNREKLASS